jgi:hypothetical protein
MTLYNVVLFVHIFVLLAAIALAGSIHGCEVLMRRAQSVAQMRVLALPGRLGPAFAVLVLLLVGFGSWLTALSKDPDKFTMSDPFIWTALVGAALLILSGPIIHAPHGKHLRTALDAAAEGPVSPELRAIALARPGVTTGWWNTCLAIGIAFNMVNKPGTVACIVDLVVASAVGILLGLWSSRPVPATVETPAPVSG